METEKGIERGILERFKLPKEEIYDVLDVIDNQVEKGRKDGLIIMEKDEILEKFYFLCMLEQWGGMAAAKKNLGAEKVEKDINDRIGIFFQPFKLESDIIKSEIEQEKNQQRYTAHLEAVKKGIISLIFEDKI